ncbi:MAG: folate family ECF transporter S component [Tissierellia bacterium]|nr:folate family ECF transporter S component [Tissierellia bacterium]
MKMKKFSTRKLVLVSMLIAIQVILKGFLKLEIGLNQRIAFSFIPLAINGALFGPVVAGISGGLADLISYLLNPTGPYFPGFTLSAILVGVIYGFFLHREKISPAWIGLTSLGEALVNMFLGSFWLAMLYGNPFQTVFMTRLPFQIILFFVRWIVLALILDRLIKPMRQKMDKGDL